MVLQPRKFKYKLRQKQRSYLGKWNKKLLNFGQLGLVLKKPIRLNSKRIFRLKLFLKKAAKRSDKTRRKVWINVFPHLPLTKKVIGSRMGKGKGKLSIWSTQLYTGHILVEFKNLRNGRAKYYFRQSRFKLKSTFKIIWSGPTQKIIKNFMGKNNLHFQSFW